MIRIRTRERMSDRFGPIILFSLTILMILQPASAPMTVEADAPELSPVGSVYYEVEGVHPLTGQVQQMFVFRMLK